MRFAMKDTKQAGDFVYTKKAAGVTITRYTGAGGELAIPAVIAGKPMTAIGSRAFRGCKEVTAITIPESVTAIGEDAFSRCMNLTAFHAAAGNPAYDGRDGVLFNKKGTTLIAYPPARKGAYVIPAGVTAIGDYAFWGCKRLQAIAIPASVTAIGEWAFRDCPRLPKAAKVAIRARFGDEVFLREVTRRKQ